MSKEWPPEERSQRGSTGCRGCGGGNILGVNKSSKKQKQNKVPQRGLGVAQLEKIRIEGLKKKDATAAMAATAILPSPQPISQGTDPFVKPGNSDVLEIGRPPGAVLMHGNVLNPSFACCPNWNPLYESDHVLPLSELIPRVQLEHLNQVNVIKPSTSTPSQSSTQLNFQMELPSNQNYDHKSYSQIVPEVEKVVGMKMPCPLSHENPLPPSLLHPETAHHTDHLTESISDGGRSRPVYHHSSGNFWSSCHCLSTLSVVMIWKFHAISNPYIYMLARNECQWTLQLSGSSSARKSNLTRGSRENGILGEVLTLALPSTSSTWLNPKLMDPLPASTSNNRNVFLDHESHHFHHGHAGEFSSFLQGSRKTGQQHQYHHSFLPPAIPQDTQAEMDSKTYDGKDLGSVDLELRL